MQGSFVVVCRGPSRDRGMSTDHSKWLQGPLAVNPRRVDKALRFQMSGLHSARRGNIRIIYRITDIVTIVAIEHRADAYRPR